MSMWSYLPTIFREAFSWRGLPRSPEPDLIMDSDANVEAYAEAARDGTGPMASNYVFHAAHMTQTIHGARRAVDLACGPATLLAMVAELNPDTSFLGVDLSEPMLESARAHIRARGLSNVEFTLGDITALDEIADGHADAVMSTMALHHLPNEQALRECFRAIGRIATDKAAIYLADLARLKSKKSIDFLVETSRGRQPELFVTDYENSLHAAFRASNFRRLASEAIPQDLRTRTTAGIPAMVVAKTRERVLPEGVVAHLHALREDLDTDDRADLDDMRLFFRLGRLGSDPFRLRRAARRALSPSGRAATTPP